MSGTTPINSLRYATLSDPANANTLSLNLATDLDTRLIPRFASAAARDSAITSPTNGMYAYTTDVSRLWLYSGSKWKWAHPVNLQLQSDQSVTSSTTYVDATNLTIPVDANSRYSFSLTCLHLATTAGDIKINTSHPAGTVWAMGSLGNSTSLAFNPAAGRGTGSSGPGFATGGTGADQCSLIHGYISTVGTAGNFKIQFAQNVSDPSASWLLAGTNLTISQWS